MKRTHGAMSTARPSGQCPDFGPWSGGYLGRIPGSGLRTQTVGLGQCGQMRIATENPRRSAPTLPKMSFSRVQDLVTRRTQSRDTEFTEERSVNGLGRCEPRVERSVRFGLRVRRARKSAAGSGRPFLIFRVPDSSQGGDPRSFIAAPRALRRAVGVRGPAAGAKRTES